mmetsp:Transcript_26621/g.58595  ORF Transcript_26621/g.58595 Transcript_26621/m.58595 type:complete len:386 (-) Transcript_26621:4-1161(-)
MIPVVSARLLGRGLRRAFLSTKIDLSKLEVTKTEKLKEHTPLKDLKFGRTFTDHMLEVDWNFKTGWSNPRIVPFGDMLLSPAATGLHYGLQCFEGLKAYTDANGKIRLFRPDKNMSRLSFSMQRIAMPALDQDGFYSCLKELLKLDKSWIPSEHGYSLYIRPTAIGSSPFLGVQPSEDVKVYVIMSPVGPYYSSGFVPIKLFADTTFCRAWPGGSGNAKLGGNYGLTIYPTQIAHEHGCQQILWLFGEDHIITEVGAMNMFFVMKKKKSDELELVTAPLTRGDVLPGVTRDSVLTLARASGKFTVSERWVPIAEIYEAALENRLLEAFGSGTAAIISPVKTILYNDVEIHIPTGEKIGPIAEGFWRQLMDIQYGVVEHPWSVVID